MTAIAALGCGAMEHAFLVFRKGTRALRLRVKKRKIRVAGSGSANSRVLGAQARATKKKRRCYGSALSQKSKARMFESKSNAVDTSRSPSR